MSDTSALIIGSPASPYVRKVLAALEVKGVAYELDPIIPFYGDDRFEAMSPLRRIPVYRDELATISDSSVICQYLEDRWPSPRLYPEDIALRAKARWLEEYADTRIGDVFIWAIFNDAVIGPAVFGSERNAERRERTLRQDVPAILDYLEAQAPEDGFLCGALSIADLAVAPHFANLDWSRATPDWTRWPRVKGWLDRTLAASPLGRLAVLAVNVLKHPRAEHRARLAEVGLKVTAETCGLEVPRRGPMSV
jgi:glutathione S-transferase